MSTEEKEKTTPPDRPTEYNSIDSIQFEHAWPTAAGNSKPIVAEAIIRSCGNLQSDDDDGHRKADWASICEPN